MRSPDWLGADRAQPLDGLTTRLPTVRYDQAGLAGFR